MNRKVPETFKHLFWDHDIDNLCPKNHKGFIIERLMEKGSVDSLQWIFKQYSQTEIISVINQSPNLTPKTRNFWNPILNEG
ncbi:hypothetical protein KJ918_03880 [Patescibacteria group bacterium]|nr:hypothetical protein [Patescibacteria group bacterium]